MKYKSTITQLRKSVKDFDSAHPLQAVIFSSVIRFQLHRRLKCFNLNKFHEIVRFNKRIARMGISKESVLNLLMEYLYLGGAEHGRSIGCV